MKKFCEEVLQDFVGVKIEEIEDFVKDIKILVDGIVEKLGMLNLNVLCYVLVDEIWIVIWLFGIELKLKFYIGMVGLSNQEVN